MAKSRLHSVYIVYTTHPIISYLLFVRKCCVNTLSNSWPGKNLFTRAEKVSNVALTRGVTYCSYRFVCPYVPLVVLFTVKDVPVQCLYFFMSKLVLYLEAVLCVTSSLLTFVSEEGRPAVCCFLSKTVM